MLALCLHCASLLNNQAVHKSIEDQTSCLPTPEYTAVTLLITQGVPQSIIGSLLPSLSPLPLTRLSAGIPLVSYAQIICTGLRGNTETSGRFFFPWRGTSCQSIQRSLLSLPPKKDPLDASSIPTLRCRDPPASDKRQSLVFRPYLPTLSRTPTVTYVLGSFLLQRPTETLSSVPRPRTGDPSSKRPFPHPRQISKLELL